MTDSDKPKTFWTVLPALLAGSASLITAAVALMSFLSSSHPKEPSPQVSPAPQTVQLKNLSECSEIVGRWDWFTGGETRLDENGGLEWRQNPYSPVPLVVGRWACTGSNPRTFLLSWQNGLTDSVTLSPDKKSLAGSNQAKVLVSGTRKS